LNVYTKRTLEAVSIPPLALLDHPFCKPLPNRLASGMRTGGAPRRAPLGSFLRLV
jgi:hypothetical protein